MHKQDSVASVGVCILLFVSMVFLVIGTKTVPSWATPEQPQKVIAYLTPHMTSERGAGRPNLRIIGSLISVGLFSLQEALLKLHFWGLNDTIIREVGSEMSGRPDTVYVTSGALAASSTKYVYVLLTLSPVLLFVMILFRETWKRVVLLLAIFSAIGGWPKSLIESIMNFFSMFLEWPHAYFLFRQQYFAYDFSTIGVVFSLLIYLSCRAEMKILEIAILSIIAQLTFEHLGLVFACAAFMRTYLDSDQRKLSKQRFLAAIHDFASIIFVSMITFSAVAFYFYWNGGFIESAVKGVSPYDWNFQSVPNFIWLSCIMITMLVPSFLVGSLIGIGFSAYQSGSDTIWLSRRTLGAHFGCFLGFGLVMIVGFFTAHYPSELGRQMISFSLVTMLLSLRFGAGLIHNLRSKKSIK